MVITWGWRQGPTLTKYINLESLRPSDTNVLILGKRHWYGLNNNWSVSAPCISSFCGPHCSLVMVSGSWQTRESALDDRTARMVVQGPLTAALSRSLRWCERICEASCWIKGRPNIHALLILEISMVWDMNQAIHRSVLQIMPMTLSMPPSMASIPHSHRTARLALLPVTLLGFPHTGATSTHQVGELAVPRSYTCDCNRTKYQIMKGEISRWQIILRILLLLIFAAQLWQRS